MTLILDGTPLPGKDPRVSVRERIERGDLSGETSASDGSHQGWKPASVEYRCLIPMEEPGWLATLRQFWQEADPNGEPLVRTVVHPTLEALRIHRARFIDNFSVTEDERLRAWHVSLNLIEVRSRPEVAAERLPVADESSGAPAAGTQDTAGEDTDAIQAAGTVEKILEATDAWIGETFFGEGES